MVVPVNINLFNIKSYMGTVLVVVPVNINLFNIKSYMGTVLVVVPVNSIQH